jgi:hypothetical protein
LGLQIQVTYADEDLVEIRVSAWNGMFGGAAEIYVNLDELEQIAGKLKGFPETIADSREIVVGELGSRSPSEDGGLRMFFYCRDSSGHAYVDLRIESYSLSKRKVQFVTCFLPIEAAAVDSFVEELARIGAERAGQAFLRGAETVSP